MECMASLFLTIQTKNIGNVSSITTMYFKSTSISALISITAVSASWDPIATYAPGSDVAEHNSLDIWICKPSLKHLTSTPKRDSTMPLTSTLKVDTHSIHRIPSVLIKDSATKPRRKCGMVVLDVLTWITATSTTTTEVTLTAMT